MKEYEGFDIDTSAVEQRMLETMLVKQKRHPFRLEMTPGPLTHPADTCRGRRQRAMNRRARRSESGKGWPL